MKIASLDEVAGSAAPFHRGFAAAGDKKDMYADSTDLRQGRALGVVLALDGQL